MANFGGYLVLKDDIRKDELYIYGDKNLIGLVLCLVDPALVIKPSMGSKTEQLNVLKNPPKSMTISIGDSEISKEMLISALQFAGIIK